MRRKPILILCTINAIAAATVLCLTLPKLLTKKASTTVEPANIREKASNEDIWSMVLNSASAREATYHLSQIDDPRFKKRQIEEQLRSLAYQENGDIPLVHELPHTTALMVAWSQLVDFNTCAELLILVFNNVTLSITAREAALVHCVQACERHYVATKDATSLTTANELISRAYETANSLQGVALRAEWFLAQRAGRATEPSDQLKKRIATTLLNPNSLESNQIACVELLQSPEFHTTIDNEGLYSLYASCHSDTLKAAVLTYFAVKKDPATRAWLRQLQPSTPRLEQHQLNAIRGLESATKESQAVN